jgi:hypothetical protein
MHDGLDRHRVRYRLAARRGVDVLVSSFGRSDGEEIVDEQTLWLTLPFLILFLIAVIVWPLQSN